MLFKLLTSCTAPNLFDRNGAHFQIDGNLGAAAGIAELLLQSHAGVVRLLPALPRAWAAGRICGLRARGGFKADIEWSAGRLVRASLRSLRGAPCTLAAPGPVRIACNGRPVPATADGPNWRFETRKGARYEIRPR